MVSLLSWAWLVREMLSKLWSFSTRLVGHVSGFCGNRKPRILEFKFPLEVRHSVGVVGVVFQADTMD